MRLILARVSQIRMLLGFMYLVTRCLNSSHVLDLIYLSLVPRYGMSYCKLVLENFPYKY